MIGNFVEALVEHESLLFVTCGHGRLVGFQLLDELTAVDFSPFTTSQALLELGHFRFSCSQSRLSLSQPLLKIKIKMKKNENDYNQDGKQKKQPEFRVNMQFKYILLFIFFLF